MFAVVFFFKFWYAYLRFHDNCKFGSCWFVFCIRLSCVLCLNVWQCTLLIWSAPRHVLIRVNVLSIERNALWIKQTSNVQIDRMNLSNVYLSNTPSKATQCKKNTHTLFGNLRSFYFVHVSISGWYWILLNNAHRILSQWFTFLLLFGLSSILSILLEREKKFLVRCFRFYETEIDFCQYVVVCVLFFFLVLLFLTTKLRFNNKEVFSQSLNSCSSSKSTQMAQTDQLENKK